MEKPLYIWTGIKKEERERERRGEVGDEPGCRVEDTRSFQGFPVGARLLDPDRWAEKGGTALLGQ